MLSTSARNKLGLFSDGNPEHWQGICRLANSGEISKDEFFYALEAHLKNVIDKYEKMKKFALSKEEFDAFGTYKKNAERSLVELYDDIPNVTYRGHRAYK